MIKSKYITHFFQKLLNSKDIRFFRKNFFYYIIFRVVRNLLSNDVIINIFNFKVFGSINNNKTSHFLLKKCYFGDDNELNTIKKISNLDSVLLVDCGCNYGFYSFYTASLSSKNLVISIEASRNTSLEFLKNLKLNNFENINFNNKAVSSQDNEIIILNESENDWESSLTHSDFKIKSTNKIKSVTIDNLLNKYQLEKYKIIIKLDIEGNEMSAIQGSLKTIKNFSPLIIIEISKYIFDHKFNRDYFENFLSEFDYSIFNVNYKKIELEELLFDLSNLDRDHKTIGNYYLIKNFSYISKLFLKYE